MIPKIIHYCWFGYGELPPLATKCIASWKKKCPDYQIVEWNEVNYDISSAPIYVQQAYAMKKWAFVTDYVRLQVVFENGGIYLDTDVELKKNLDSLLGYSAFFGFEDSSYINTGHGFGAEKGTPILKELMSDYFDIPFVLSDGGLDRLPCPQRNTPVFIKHGLIQNDERQVLPGNILIEPSIIFCPIDYKTGKYRKSRQTISVHWFNASWKTQQERELHKKNRKKAIRNRRIDFWKTIVRKLIGDKHYYRLKQKYRQRKSSAD